MRDLTKIKVQEFNRGEDLVVQINHLPQSQSFNECLDYFKNYPENSLLAASERVILYQLIRSLKPKRVLEIGSYYAGTSEVLARVLWANGVGELITIDPFGTERVPKIIKTWPKPLQDLASFYSQSSMDFFGTTAANLCFDLIVIDGNHDYSFALFDIMTSAIKISPGGIIIMDNAEQPGVFWAAKHFLQLNPSWQEIGGVFERHSDDSPYQTMSFSMEGVPAIILVAPSYFPIGTDPVSYQFRLPDEDTIVKGFTIEWEANTVEEKGTLNALVYLRTFWHQPSVDGNFPEELKILQNAVINVRDKTLDIYLDNPLKSTLDPVNTYCTCEILLSWQSSNSNQELQLIKTPELITAKDPNYEEKALIKINQLFNQLNEEKAQNQILQQQLNQLNEEKAQNQILQQQLEQLKSQIHQAEEENAAMKTSKFWKLLTQWFRIKKIFGFKE